MDKLAFYICENFAAEYQHVIETEGLTDAEVKTYPCVCEKRWLKAEAQQRFLEHPEKSAGLLVCSQNCEALKFAPDQKRFGTMTGSYCFSRLLCDEFLDYLVQRGSYLVTSAWLENWPEHLSNMGFDQNTARTFFQEVSQQLVLIDSGIFKDSQTRMEDFAAYVGLPYQIITTHLDGIRLLVKSSVLEWRLNQSKHESDETIQDLRNQCFEYSAVLNILSKISTYTSKREVIGEIKEIFQSLFGAGKFMFWAKDAQAMPEEVSYFLSGQDSVYQLLKDRNEFLIRIQWDDIFYGVLDAGDFIFPQYIQKYLNFALKISRYCSLALHNSEQYERLMKSEQKLKYLNSHDPLTGLYNRSYINQILETEAVNEKTAVFMMDIDRLKFVNDTYGHAEGDALIQNFARIIRESFRETDVVARIGGDEFVALLYNADAALAEVIKDRILLNIRQHNEHLTSSRLELSASVGYHIIDDGSLSLESAIIQADERMYADKRRKKAQQIEEKFCELINEYQ